MKIITKIFLIVFLFSFTIAQSKISFSKSLNEISKIILSEDIVNIENHLERLDSIYIKSLRLMNNDISETLFSLTFVCLPYNKMPLKIPLIAVTLNIPLPSPNDSLYKAKNKILPSQLEKDSPDNSFGDKDKLSHFFGNAFLTFNLNFFNISKFIGILIELFEDSFKVEGGIDSRDFKYNNLGSQFGKKLKEFPNILPSSVLINNKNEGKE